MPSLPRALPIQHQVHMYLCQQHSSAAWSDIGRWLDAIETQECPAHDPASSLLHAAHTCFGDAALQQNACHAVVKVFFYRGPAFSWHAQEEGCGAKDVRRIYDEDTTVNSSEYVYT